MTISVYMEYLAYKFGGAESYTASLLEALQNIYRDAQIEVITESFGEFALLSAEELVERLNAIYGTSVSTRNFSVSYFYFGKRMRVPEGNCVQKALHELSLRIRTLHRFKKIYQLSANRDLFVNASFNILAGGARKNMCVMYFPRIPLRHINVFKRWAKRFFYVFRLDGMEREYGQNYDMYLPISEFTAEWTEKYWNIPKEKECIVYPPVKMVEKSTLRKNRNQIFICSRIEKTKCIKELIEAYSNSDILKKNATLVIAGSVIGEDASYIEKITHIDAAVRIVFDPSREELDELYASSGIFWHAKGYGTEKPWEFEHFGMTTVEAMSAGCISVVIDKGGQREIVAEGCGFRWNTLSELVARTEELVLGGEHIEKIRKNARERAQLYSKSAFTARLRGILSEAGIA